MFPAKFKTLQVLKTVKERFIEGCVFEVYRSTSDANTGDVLTLKKQTKEDLH